MSDGCKSAIQPLCGAEVYKEVRGRDPSRGRRVGLPLRLRRAAWRARSEWPRRIVSAEPVNDANGVVNEFAQIIATKLGDDMPGSGKTAGLLGAMITF